MQQTQPIKILHIITRLILGGAQENTLYTVKGLSVLPEYRVVLATGPAIGPEGSLLDQAKKQKLNVSIIPQLRRAINPAHDIIALIKLYLFIKKNNFKIVHTHSSKAGIIGRWAAHLAKTPVIVHTIHGLPFYSYQNKFLNLFYKFLEQISAKITAKLITVSNTIIAEAIEAGIAKKDKFITIYSGIELDRFNSCIQNASSLRVKLNIPQNAIVIGKIARLFHNKGHVYVLEAAQEIIKNNKDVYFLFVGDGILKKALERKAIELKISHNIIFTGLITPDKIPAYIHAMDIVVHASLHEGLPRAVVEAFACKKPVVAFDIDGAREIVREGETGFLVPAKDKGALKNKICQLISSKDQRNDFGMRGYETVVKNFTKEKMISDIDRLYKELLSQCGY